MNKIKEIILNTNPMLLDSNEDSSYKLHLIINYLNSCKNNDKLLYFLKFLRILIDNNIELSKSLINNG